MLVEKIEDFKEATNKSFDNVNRQFDDIKSQAKTDKEDLKVQIVEVKERLKTLEEVTNQTKSEVHADQRSSHSERRAKEVWWKRDITIITGAFALLTFLTNDVIPRMHWGQEVPVKMTAPVYTVPEEQKQQFQSMNSGSPSITSLRRSSPLQPIQNWFNDGLSKSQ